MEESRGGIRARRDWPGPRRLIVGLAAAADAAEGGTEAD
jgi:hypothetical protein